MVHRAWHLLLVIALLVAVALAVPGCDSSQQEEDISAQTGDTQDGIRVSADSSQQEEDMEITSTSESSPIEIDLELSRAPKLGETAELTFTIMPNYLPDRGTTQYRAWIEVTYVNTTGSYQESKLKLDTPASSILASGQSTTWDVILAEGEPVELRSTVRFSEEGIWEIMAFLQRDGSERTMWGDDIRVAVYQDRAGIYGARADQVGELAWMRDYSPNVGSRTGSSTIGQVTTTLDLSRPPRVGEPIELTWSIVSAKDVKQASVWIDFYLMTPGRAEATTIPEESILVTGDVHWEGSLQKHTPVSSSATIIFPEEGDWQIVLWRSGTDIASLGAPTIYLSSTEAGGRWGWVESHREETGGDHELPSAPWPTD